MSSENVQTKWGQFIPLVTVFFFWGFVAASNDILIPVFKKAFDLTQGQIVPFSGPSADSTFDLPSAFFACASATPIFVAVALALAADALALDV